MLIEHSTDKAQSQVLKQAWGDFVDTVGQRKGGWDWFATLTFRDRTPAEQALGWTKVGWSYSDKACNEFLGALRDRKGLDDLWWCKAREIQTWRGVPHWHLLLGGVAALQRDEAWLWWFQRYGFARVLPYQAELGAGYYLCKYVTKQLGDIRFSPNLTKP